MTNNTNKVGLPKEGKSYPLWLLVAVKEALFCCTEDPDLDHAHKVLFAIDAALAEAATKGK